MGGLRHTCSGARTVASISTLIRSRSASRAPCCCQAAWSAADSWCRSSASRSLQKPAVNLRPGGVSGVSGVGARGDRWHVPHGICGSFKHLREHAANLLVVDGLRFFGGHKVGSVQEGTAQVPDRDVGDLKPGQPGAQPWQRLAGLGSARVKPGAVLGACQGPVGVAYLVAEAPGPVQHPVGHLT